MSNIDKQARAELRKRYTPPEIPKCCICGAALSVQSCGGGEPTVYACDGYEPDPDNPGHVRRAAGRSVADRHYDMSRYIDWLKGGDPEVIALLDELEAAEKRIAELEAKQVKIKLPESFYPDGDIECPLVINEYQIIEAIVAADCKPIAVCPRCKRELDLSHKHDGAHYCHAAGTGKGE